MSRFLRKTSVRRTAAWVLTASLLAGAAAPAFAGPVPSSAASLGRVTSDFATSNHVTDVRWRHGGGVAAGVAAGLIVGGLAAAAANPYYYGPGPYYYGPPPDYYAPPPVYYAPPPAYYGPPPGPNGPGRQCWVTTDKDRGFGYWRPC